MNPYALLELEPGASEEEVRRAWKRLARVHHPDLNPDDPGAAERFKRIRAAYDALLSGELGAELRARSMDEAWVDAVAWMVRVRQREVLEELLPRMVSCYGRGAALAWALGRAEDLEAAARALPAPRRIPRVLRRLELEVVIDDRRAWWGLASIEKRSAKHFQVVLYATELWRRRPPDEEQLRRVIYAAVDHGLAAALPVAWRLPQVATSLEEARVIDREIARHRWLWRLIWSGVAALSALMLGWSASH